MRKADDVKHLIDVSGWGEFSCRNLFECKNTGNILARDVENGSGTTPFVTASGYNNGVVGYIDASKYDIIKGHCILVGGKTFTITYQKDDFVSNDSHNFTIRVKDYNISDLCYLYLVSAIYTYFGQKYSWNDAVTKDKLMADNIPLPIDTNGEPDWQYMESYMKAVMEESEKSLENLRKADDAKHLIDTSSWVKFKLSDIGFTNHHGIRQTKADRKEGDIPLLTAGKENQGVAAYISNAPSVYTDAITVDMFGNSFFHKGNYAGDDNIYFFINDKISDNAKLFIAAILNTDNSKIYAYKEQFRQPQADALSVSLPATSEGQPDWDYMESYMKAVMEESEKSLENLRKADDTKHLIDVSRWGEFRVGDLFDIHPTSSYKVTNVELLNDNGCNPVVANSGFNNGIVGYTDYECNENAGVITFTDTAAKSSESFFYQKDTFVGYPHVQGMYCKQHDLNEYEGKYMTTVLRSAAGKFDFITKMTREVVNEFVIKLPITSTGEPDWQYMEDYMKAIMDKSEQIISDLQIGA